MCGPKFLQDFVAACKAMLPLVEFTTWALGLEPSACCFRTSRS